MKVIPQKKLDYIPNLKEVKPDFAVHVNDWKTGVQKEVRQRVVDTLAEWGSELIEHKYTEGISSADYYDFYIPKLNKTRKYDYEVDSVSLDAISGYDLLILATDHDDYDMLIREMQLIVDTRVGFSNTHKKVIKS